MSKNNITRGGALLLLVCAIAAAALWREELAPQRLLAWIEALGWLAPVVFIACYAASSVLFIPGTVLTLAGGALFGPVFGTLYNLIGATAGATLAFLSARHIASEWVEDRSGARLLRLVDGVNNEGWRFVAFSRLVPLFPFNLLNYALGLTRIRLSHYVLATFVFMAPSAAAYTYLGYAGREAAAGGENVVKKALIAIAVVATLAFASQWLMRKRQRKEASAKE